jgi:hypothetical protein
MSNYETKPNTGNIFKNEKKGDNEKAPDYKGLVNIEGKELEVALWVKEGKKGKYFSAKFQEKREPKTFTKESTDLPF